MGGIGTTTTVTYDAMDRVSTSTDAFGQVVGYTYDNPGRVKTLTYPGSKVLTRGYDPLGRLTSLTDWAGRVTTFGYDNASRLTSRTYPNGLVQTLSYDTPGRVATSQLAQGGSSLIALNYAYDANSNPTATTSKGILPPTPPAPYDQTSRFTPAGRLIDKVDAADPTHSGDFTYQFDASGNMTQATSPARSYGFSYDEDNRVLSVNSTASGQTTGIQNRYDALGRRISRTLGSTETRYVLDLTGGMERILCDTDASGTVTARYIHGPDLCYKEDASTSAITCYHADAQGNIVRTTDAAGANVNQYAYFAYGRLASTSGTAANPYRFVGSQGIMEELPNLYFMRARYYSAEAGVFLSTDPVKKIGPGWKAQAYGYVNQKPLSFIDPVGTYAIKIGASLSLNASWFGGVEWSAGVGVALETAALSSGDFGNGLGIYDETEIAGTLGTEIGFGPGADFKLSGDPSGYGVKSIEGWDPFSGTSNYEGGIARASISNNGGWSLGLGPKAEIGYSVSAGKSGTVVGALGSGSSQAFSSSVSASSSGVSRSPVAAIQATTSNSATQTRMAPAASSSTSTTGGNGSSTYTIRPGDTIGNLAYQFGVSSAALLSANPQIKSADVIYAYATITVPAPTSSASKATSAPSTKASTTSSSKK